MFNVEKKILNNGINLVAINKDTQIASIHIGIKIGALYEKNNERGISHFIEHMLFKGTKTINNELLNKKLEQLGGEYNAYTDNSSTVLSVTSLAEELPKAIEILSDMLQNSIFPIDEMEREREVILSEIRSSKDDIEDFSFNKVNEIAFENSSLRYDTLGNEESVKSFTQDDLKEFYDTYYVSNNCYISIVSPYSHEEIKDLVEKNFKNWIWKEFKRINVIEENNKFIKKISYKKDLEQSTIVYLYTFYGLDKNEELALRVLSHRLGESANSILFRKVREEKGLAYDIYTDLDLSHNVKTLYIYTSTAKENVDEAINSIEDCINNLKNRKINFGVNTINLMKKILKTAIAFTLEDATDLSNYILNQCMDGEEIYQFYDDMKNLDNITEEQIYKVANKVFNDPAIHILLNE